MIFTEYSQCSKLVPVRLPEADNFGGGPGTFSSILCLWFEIQRRRTVNFFDWVLNTDIHARCIISCLKSSFLMHLILTERKNTMSSFIAAQGGLCDYKMWWIAGCFQHKSCMALAVIWGYKASRAHVLWLNTWSAVRLCYFFSAILNIIWSTKNIQNIWKPHKCRRYFIQ